MKTPYRPLTRLCFLLKGRDMLAFQLTCKAAFTCMFDCWAKIPKECMVKFLIFALKNFEKRPEEGFQIFRRYIKKLPEKEKAEIQNNIHYIRAALDSRRSLFKYVEEYDLRIVDKTVFPYEGNPNPARRYRDPVAMFIEECLSKEQYKTLRIYCKKHNIPIKLKKDKKAFSRIDPSWIVKYVSHSGSCYCVCPCDHTTKFLCKDGKIHKSEFTCALIIIEYMIKQRLPVDNHFVGLYAGSDTFNKIIDKFGDDKQKEWYKNVVAEIEKIQKQRQLEWEQQQETQSE